MRRHRHLRTPTQAQPRPLERSSTVSYCPPRVHLFHPASSCEPHNRVFAAHSLMSPACSLFQLAWLESSLYSAFQILIRLPLTSVTFDRPLRRQGVHRGRVPGGCQQRHRGPGVCLSYAYCCVVRLGTIGHDLRPPLPGFSQAASAHLSSCQSCAPDYQLLSCLPSCPPLCRRPPPRPFQHPLRSPLSATS